MQCYTRAYAATEINPSTIITLRRRHACIIVCSEIFREIPIRIVKRHRRIHRRDNARPFVSWPRAIAACQLIG